jgi:hypothetical protein
MTFDTNARNDADWTIPSRRSCRTTIDLPIALTTQGQDTLSATLADISTGGCKVRSMYAVAPGRFLTINIPEFASYSGWVAWGNGFEFGLDLSNPIPAGVVQYLINLAQKHDASDDAWLKALLAKSRPLLLSAHAKPTF